MNSTNLKCKYIITAFFFGIENGLTIFGLHPSDKRDEKRASVHSKLLVLMTVQFVAEVRCIIWNWILSPNRIFSSFRMIHWIHASQRF